MSEVTGILDAMPQSDPGATRTRAPMVGAFLIPPRGHWPGSLRLTVPRALWLCGLLALAVAGTGCAGSSVKHATFDRPFVFQQDSFAFTNELEWDYHFDAATGKTTHTPRVPRPEYTQHCFVLARSARQFFQHARFAPTQPVADTNTYLRLVRRVIATSPRTVLPEHRRIVIPGYSNLFSFSRAHEALLKAQCGGAWQSYWQRGHWRMIFPFSERHQEKMARVLVDSLHRNWPPVVHVVRFPSRTINHALVLFDVMETESEIHFAAYDPNTPQVPACLAFNRNQRRFSFPANSYFIGGPVDVYEVYHAWNY
jgi:hypothetical protein